MRLKTLKGQLVWKNVSKYKIKWDKVSVSKLQTNVKEFLRSYWFYHSVYEEFPVFGTRLRVDFVNFTKRLAIEVHGPQHNEFHFFHQKSRLNYLYSIQRDYKKIEWLELNGFTVLEFTDEDVDKLTVNYITEKFGVSIV